MNAVTDLGFGWASPGEERALRRRLLFRLLKSFDFDAPELIGERITPLATPDQMGPFRTDAWAEALPGQF